MKHFRISRGKQILADCTLKEVSWDLLSKSLSVHKLAKDKKDHGWFVGGVFADNYRNGENILSRSLVVMDIDHYEGCTDDVLIELENLPYKLVAYSTYRSTFDIPRFRIVFPLTNEILASDYEPLCKAIANEFKGFVFDPCGFKPELAMYMPSAPEERIGEAFTFSKEGDELDINDFDIEKFRENTVDSGQDDDQGDLEQLLAYQPLDISDEQVKDCLATYKAEGIDRADWVNVGRGLYHQYEGSEQGYQLWLDWSSLDSTRFKEKEMPSKWQSFEKKLKKKKPITFATVIDKADEIRKKDVLDFFDTVISPANETDTIADDVEGEGDNKKETQGGVVDNKTYKELCKRIKKVPLSRIAESERQAMAQDIWHSWGKDAGIKKSTIEKELMPFKKDAEADFVNYPEWAEGWIYIATRCKYHNLETNYDVNKEGFNQMFSGKDDCKGYEMSASQLMSVIYPMKFAIDYMYFPGMGEVFQYEGKDMLNTFKVSGVPPATELDVDGQGVVDLFLKHVNMTFSNKRELTIMMDWMSYIVQNPGKKLNWALLLQGAQGTGKSYFGAVMQGVLGNNAKKVKPEAIMGRFSSWATGSILNIVEEIYVGGSDKYALMNRIKDYIRNDTIQIEEKGRDHRNVPNFASYLFFTNYQDALAITDDERGFCIIYGAIQSQEQLYKELGGLENTDNYFKNLFTESERRIDALAYYLLNREISADFQPKGRAPLTEGRSAMIGYSTNSDVDNLQDLIDRHKCEVINNDIVDITYLAFCIETSFDNDDFKLPAAKITQHILLGLGYQKVKNRIKISKTENKKERKHTVWMKNLILDDIRIALVQNFHKDQEM